MDKKLSRQILYKAENNNSLKSGKESSPKSINTQDVIKKGEKLAQWIKKAELINKSALCKSCKIDRGNLDKYLSKGIIPEQHIGALVLILKNYGYAE